MKIMIHSSPSTIYQYLGDDPRKILEEIVKKFTPELRAVLEAQKPIPKRLLMIAAQFPEVTINLGHELTFSNPRLASVVKSNTTTAFYLLMSNYSKLAGQLEAIILNDGQYTLELLQQANKHRIKLKHTLEYYEKSLLRDPYFANIYNNKIPSRSILKHYEGTVITEEPQTFASAFIQLSIAKSTNTTLDSERLKKCEDLIHQHPLYALFGATRLKTMGISIDAKKINNLNPRYASALLRYGVVSNSDHLIDKLLINPLWLAHYIFISVPSITPDKIRELHDRMKQAINDSDNQAYKMSTKAISNYLNSTK